jgi:hypothetical protein
MAKERTIFGTLLALAPSTVSPDLLAAIIFGSMLRPDLLAAIIFAAIYILK